VLDDLDPLADHPPEPVGQQPPGQQPLGGDGHEHVARAVGENVEVQTSSVVSSSARRRRQTRPVGILRDIDWFAVAQAS